MYLTTKRMDEAAIRHAARHVGAALYGGNLTADVEHVGGNRYRVKIGAASSHERGARRSWSGRRGPWACWHAFRDVFAAWLLLDPDAVIRTGMATYRGARSFLDEYPRTADQNIGSVMSPAYMAELCDCEDADTYGAYVGPLMGRTFVGNQQEA